MRSRTFRRGAAAVVLVLGAAAGCSGGDDSGGGNGGGGGGGNGGGGASSEADGTLTVVATPTVRRAVERLVSAYGDEPGADEVELIVASASDLEGLATDADLVIAEDRLLTPIAGDGELQPFGRNLYVIATPEGNPAGIVGLADLDAAAGHRVIVCGPVSQFENADRILEAAGVVPAAPRIAGPCANTAVPPLENGEADAALLPRNAITDPDTTDIVFTVPDETNQIIPLSLLVRTADDAESFLEFTQGAAGERIRTVMGYLP